MIAFAARRILEMAFVLFLVVSIVFFMVRAVPGNPFAAEKSLPPHVEKHLREKYGLNRSVGEQYLSYLGLLARGDLGPCFKYKSITVNDIIASALPVSAFLGFTGLTLAIIGGVLLGTLASVGRGTAADYFASGVAFLGICVPSFVTGPFLILVFAFGLGWLPVGKLMDLRSLILPAVTLSLPYLATIARLTRAGLLENLPKDYVRTARAKGLSERAVVFKHALRNSIIPVVTYLGPAAAGILTGSFVVEHIFAVPGLGRHFVNSALNRDYNLILGTSAVYVALLVFFNALVDLSYGWIDPQVRHAGARGGAS